MEFLYHKLSSKSLDATIARKRTKKITFSTVLYYAQLNYSCYYLIIRKVLVKSHFWALKCTNCCQIHLDGFLYHETEAYIRSYDVNPSDTEHDPFLARTISR